MSRTYIGEFISQKIVENFDGPKDYMQVHKVETSNGVKYFAVTKDGQKYDLKQISDEEFSMTIGEDTYILSPEDGDYPEI